MLCRGLSTAIRAVYGLQASPLVYLWYVALDLLHKYRTAFSENVFSASVFGGGMLGVSNTICSFAHSEASWAPKFEASHTSKLLARSRGSRLLLFKNTNVQIERLLVTRDGRDSWTNCFAY